VRTFADLRGESDAVELLQQTLKKEKATDRKLNMLAEKINVKAEVEAEESGKSKRKGKAARA
jgi:ferritin-like metal-binding protein YciE